MRGFGATAFEPLASQPLLFLQLPLLGMEPTHSGHRHGVVSGLCPLLCEAHVTAMLCVNCIPFTPAPPTSSPPLAPPTHIPLPCPTTPPKNTPAVQALLESKVPVLAFYFGLPDPALLSKVQRAGVLTMGTATNKQEALQLLAAGIDCIVVQGMEAGGHRGTW